MELFKMKIIKIKKALANYIKLFNAHTCCFTGHRPQSLPWKFNEQDERCLKMKERLKTEIIKAIENGYTTFISGMALGFDMICAEMVLELKKTYSNIKLVGAIPCKTQDRFWQTKDKQRYKSWLAQLDKVRCIYDDYIGPECMLERNRFMVNNSSLIIALFNGTNGGTKKTIDYAKKQGVKIVILKP